MNTGFQHKLKYWFLPENSNFCSERWKNKHDFMEPTATWNFRITTWECSDLNSNNCIKISLQKVELNWNNWASVTQNTSKFCLRCFLSQQMPAPKSEIRALDLRYLQLFVNGGGTTPPLFFSKYKEVVLSRHEASF